MTKRATSEQHLTRHEIAARFGVHYNTVLGWVRTNKLRETRLPSGRGVRSLPRYAMRDVLAFEQTFWSAGLR